LAGNAKNAEVFAGEPRLRHLAVPYARTGALRDRLAASASLADAIPSGALVLDPDSRLSQLGLVPVASDDRYFFFESRSAGGDSDSTIGELTAKWCAECFGVQARPWIAPVAGTGGEPRICLSLGTGENPEKGLGGQFEAALVRAAASLGLPVLIDKGMGGEEGERVERAITAVDAPPGQIETWLGPFAPFAFEIARAPLYIGYDSAGQHVAAAAGTPLRCLFAGAPSDRFYQRWKPWGSAANVIVRTGTPPDWRAALAALRLSA
jgi:hypothetical protein